MGIQIPNEAVEAAARAFFGTLALSKWEDLGPITQNAYRDKAERALEAAAPFIRADAGAKALEDAAGHLGHPGIVWWGDLGAGVKEEGDGPLRFTPLSKWLRARAAHERAAK